MAESQKPNVLFIMADEFRKKYSPRGVLKCNATDKDDGAAPSHEMAVKRQGVPAAREIRQLHH